MDNKLQNNLPDFENILILIQDAKSRVFAKANSELVLLYFNVGKIVSEKVKQGNWGENTVQELADFIKIKAPNLSGFNRRGLYRMKQFFETYANPEFVTTLATQFQSNENTQISKVPDLGTLIKKLPKDRNQSQKVTPLVTQMELDLFLTKILCNLSWSHHLLILGKAKTTEEKLFYISHAIIEKLSKRELERQLNAGIFERSVIADKSLVKMNASLPQGIFKDPYIFEFLDLPDGHSEKDFEKAITLNLKNFILEIGKGFAYMGNQYKLQVGNKDFYTDLLFYHRDLQCLVLFELKIQDFEPEFVGKLNFYLEALDRDVKRPHENPSIGILLCKGKDTEVVEYAMARNTSPALIAEYETKLIDKKLLANKLNQLVAVLNKEKE
ncbi:MAG: PDDEXK nuclease domain-containing protein [Saprospiraceae bacterium]